MCGGSIHKPAVSRNALENGMPFGPYLQPMFTHQESGLGSGGQPAHEERSTQHNRRAYYTQGVTSSQGRRWPISIKFTRNT